MASNPLDYPFKWNPLSLEALQGLKDDYEEDGMIFECLESDPGKVWMTSNVLTDGPEIYNFALRPDDIWVVTYPKCGTTWTQELLWLIMHKADFSTCVPLVSSRSPFLEYQTLLSSKMKQKYLDETSAEDREQRTWTLCKTIEFANTLASPRLIKSHLPLCMLPPKLLDTCKVIYVCRNPLDVCVSFFHHSQLLLHEVMKADRGFAEFAQRFRSGEYKYGSYWSHLKDARRRLGHPNLKFLWYEDLKKDLIPVIKDLCTFLSYDLTAEQMTQIDDFLRIENYRKFRSENPVKNNEKARRFFRKGQVGDYVNYFDDEALKDWNAWIDSHLLDEADDDLRKRFLSLKREVDF